MIPVSVVMPVYNGELCVANAVRSIQAQSFHDWEMLIVDDGSTDQTYAILSALAEGDSRIRIIRNEQNLRLAASLNRAIAQSQSEWIARMDADDVAMPNRLAHQMDFLHEHADVAVLGGGSIDVDLKGQPIGETYRYEQHAELAAKIYKENPFIHPTVLARRNFFETLGGYNPERRVEDYDLWFRGYRQFKYHNLQIPLIYYRRPEKPNWTRTTSAARVIWDAIIRERKPIWYGWYVIRMFLAYGSSMLGLKR